MAIVAPGVVQSLLFDPTLSAVASPENAFRIVALLCVFYGGFAFITALNRLGRRLRWTATAVRAKKLGYPAVLYLRDFTDDTRLVAAGDVISHPANEIFSFRARIPYEEVIGRELGRNGPVLAIAEPGSPRAFLPLGASRKWLLDREWRDAVRREMSHAVLIIIAVGATEGLLWEVMTATREGLLDKVILLMPPDEDDALRKRWAATANAIRTAGGPALDLTVDPACLLAMQVSATGPRQVIVSDRRDEYSYNAALDVALTSPATATVTAAWISNRMAKIALRETPSRSNQLSMRPGHGAFAELSRLSWVSMHRLPPARRRTKPWLAVLLAVFLNGVGIALYFRRRVDILAGLALGWPLFFLPGLLAELGQSGQSSGPATEQAMPWWFWLWLGICALYAYLRAYSSNERLSAADAGGPPGTRTEADDVDGYEGGASA